MWKAVWLGRPTHTFELESTINTAIMSLYLVHQRVGGRTTFHTLMPAGVFDTQVLSELRQNYGHASFMCAPFMYDGALHFIVFRMDMDEWMAADSSVFEIFRVDGTTMTRIAKYDRGHVDVTQSTFAFAAADIFVTERLIQTVVDDVIHVPLCSELVAFNVRTLSIMRRYPYDVNKCIFTAADDGRIYVLHDANYVPPARVDGVVYRELPMNTMFHYDHFATWELNSMHVVGDMIYFSSSCDRFTFPIVDDGNDARYGVDWSEWGAATAVSVNAHISAELRIVDSCVRCRDSAGCSYDIPLPTYERDSRNVVILIEL